MPKDRLYLTPKQKDVLHFIKIYIGKHSTPPVVNDIAAHLECNRANAYMIVERLIKKGFVMKEHKGTLAFLIPQKPVDGKINPALLSQPTK